MGLAVVFPGQGSQSVGMLSELADQHAQIASTFSEASEVLGMDLWTLAQTGPAEKLSDTRITQPLMFTADIALWRVLRKHGISAPTAMAGHSLGEFAALVASGALSFEDGVKLVARRAQLMAAAVPEGEGGMAALLGMDDQVVVDLCASVSGKRVSEAVNFNAPGQVAISGHLDALEQTVAAAKEQGCRKAMMLAVSVPNHSSLMRTAGESLATYIDELSFNEPAMPLLQNATAAVAADQATLLARLKEHVYKPVYWTRTIEALRDNHGVSLIIEVGPGKVLSGLSKRIDKALPCLPIDTPDALAKALEAISQQAETVS